MTNLQYFISQLGYTPLANMAEAAIIDAGLVTTDTYVLDNQVALKTQVLSALYLLLSTPDTDQGNGETHMNIKYDRNAILRRIGILEGELGLSAKPTIKALRAW